MSELGSRPRRSARPCLTFFVLRELPCPYLPGQQERKIVTELSGPAAPSVYGDLSRGGFRRTHLFSYRPACRTCDACVPVRVDARRYAPSKSLARTARRNADLRVSQQPPIATREQFALFARYLDGRHGDGEMAKMTFADYRSMVEETAVTTRIAEFRDENRRLVGACLLDVTDDGTSAVYSFFDPEMPERSLGTYIIHWLIVETRAMGHPYVYLGYWIAESPKMAYKIRFKPVEALGREGWRPLFAGK